MEAQSALHSPGVEDLQSLLDEGRYEEVLGVDASSYPLGESGRVQIIRSKAYLRVDTDDARRQARTLAQTLCEGEHRTEALQVLGRVSYRENQFPEARSYLTTAQSEATGDRLAEIGYSLAYCDYLERKYDPSSLLTYGAFDTKRHDLLGRAYYLQAFMHYGLRENRDFLRLLIRSAGHYELAPRREVETLASIAMNLVCIGTEVFDYSAVVLGERLYGDIEKLPNLHAAIRELQHITLRGLATFRKLRGEIGTSSSLLRYAAKVAPSEAYRILAVAERASIALANRETTWLNDLLEDAAERYDDVDWLKTTVQEPLALTTLAEVWASRDAARAKEFADLFAVVQNIQRERQGANYQRYAALYDMARAKQLAAAGNTKTAIKLFEVVYDEFTALSFTWRAGEALIELGKLKKERNTIIRGRDQVASVYPNSLIVKNTDAYLLAALFTKTERRVINAVLEGVNLSSAIVSASLEMTVQTLDIHVNHICNKIGATGGRKGIASFFVQTGCVNL